MVDYNRTKKTADRLITKYGKENKAILRRYGSSGPAYDPTITGPQNYNVTVVVLSYSNWELGDGRVLSSDKKVLLSVGKLAIEPLPSDQLLIGGIIHNIVGPKEGNGIKPLSPGGTVIMYEVQCRR